MTFFINGVTMALFVAAGTAAPCNERLTMSVRGSISSLRHSFNRAVGKASRSHVADEDSTMILRTSMVSVEGNTSSLERIGFWLTACRNWFIVSCCDSSDRKSLILTIFSTKKVLKEEAKSSLGEHLVIQDQGTSLKNFLQWRRASSCPPVIQGCMRKRILFLQFSEGS